MCRAQQEILRQRQNPQAQAKYFNEVNKRRQEVSNNGESHDLPHAVVRRVYVRAFSPNLRGTRDAAAMHASARLEQKESPESHDLACAPVNEKFNLAKGGKDPIIKWMELKKAGKIPDREKYEGVEDKVRRTSGCRYNKGQIRS
jgi:hypothetical protein